MDGIIDIETVAMYYPPNIPLIVWEKHLPIVQEWRERYNNPNYHQGFEYLVNEIKRS